MTRFAALIIIDDDDPALLSKSVPDQWDAVLTAVAGGRVASVMACFDEQDAAALAYAYQSWMTQIGEPLPEAPAGLSVRRH